MEMATRLQSFFTFDQQSQFFFGFVFVFVRVKVFAFAREKVPVFGFSPFSVEDCPGINGIINKLSWAINFLVWCRILI